jgi:hypothetical protein
MKTATYTGLDGKKFTVDYDETAPCSMCAQPVQGASMGGTAICGACDCGRCRYCNVSCGIVFKDSIDGGASKRQWQQHVAHCREVHEKARAFDAAAQAK